jgi:error-prone DNA polymerase
VIVAAGTFEGFRLTLVEEPFLLIDGILQRQDGVVSVKARHLAPLPVATEASVSHDFH